MLMNIIMTISTIIVALTIMVVGLSVTDNYQPTKLVINEHEGFGEKA